MSRFQHHQLASYRAPGRDSTRAQADATMFLCGVRTLDGVTADTLAHRYRLKLPTAERLLADAVKRRGL